MEAGKGYEDCIGTKDIRYNFIPYPIYILSYTLVILFVFEWKHFFIVQVNNEINWFLKKLEIHVPKECTLRAKQFLWSTMKRILFWVFTDFLRNTSISTFLVDQHATNNTQTIFAQTLTKTCADNQMQVYYKNNLSK